MFFLQNVLTSTAAHIFIFLFVTCTLQYSEIPFSTYSMLVRRLGSEHRVGHNSASGAERVKGLV